VTDPTHLHDAPDAVATAAAVARPAAPTTPAAVATPALVGSGSPSRSRGLDAQSVGLVAVFTALLVAAAVVPGIPVGPIGVPITLQTLAVMLTGLVLGPGRATAAVLLYLLIGFVGLPVFSRGQSGLQVLAGPSAGYLVSFVLAALVLGLASRSVLRRARRAWWAPLFFVATLLTTLLVVHPLGVAGLMLNAKLSFSAALAADLPFLPGDIVKGLVAAIAAAAVHRAFPDVLVRRVARR
jgi:biotin transport system substrate-specific component